MRYLRVELGNLLSIRQPKKASYIYYYPVRNVIIRDFFEPYKLTQTIKKIAGEIVY